MSLSPNQMRTYHRATSVVFLKTNEKFGGLSNMAGGFPLSVSGFRIRTSEALYQVCRYPYMPDVQTLIVEQKSPMTAKMKSKPYRKNSREDWDRARVKIMRWCLRVKLAQNWRTFSELLLETADRPIVEESWKDDFWGARPTNGNTLVGMNILGRLLMELREAVKAESRDSLLRVQPLTIPDFLLDGRAIGVVTAHDAELDDVIVPASGKPSLGDVGGRMVIQPSLFDEPVEQEASLPVYPGVNEKVVRVADLKPYAEYKATTHEWLGSLPAHWDLLRAKYLFREVDERSTTGGEELLSVSHLTGVTPRSQKKITMFLAKSNVGHKLCRPCDVVINTMWAWMGALGVARHVGIVSPAYGVYRPLVGRDVLPRYADLLLRTPAYIAEYQRRSTGVNSSRLRLYPEHFLRIEVVVPPPQEQEAIVRFLDWSNGRLGKMIRAKQKIVALLNEQKQAIIHRAVTRGLDPSAPLKPSGIPWLGDIPQHWEIRKLKHITRFVNGLPFKPRDWKAEGVPIIRIQNLNGSDAFNYTTRSDLPEELLIHAGDLMFAWSGNRGTSFGSFEWDRKFAGYLNQHIFKLVGFTLPKRYFFYVLRAVTRHVEDQAGGIIGLVHVTKPELGSVQVPLAPIAEAEAIAEHIDSETGGLHTAISRLESEIELLREYRTRLVADVVTGKLDVREAAAKLPEEAAPDIADDETNLSIDLEAAD